MKDWTGERRESVGAKGFPVVVPRGAFRRNRHSTPQPSQASTREELALRLRRFDFFATLPEPTMGVLVDAAEAQTFRAGERIWSEGDAVGKVLFVERGLAKLARRNKEGVSRTYGLYGPGDSMGFFALWSGNGYPTDALALNDGMTGVFVEAETVRVFSEEWPRLAASVRVELARFTDAFFRKIEIVSAGTVPQRLALLMTSLVDRYGVERADGTAHLPFALTLEQTSEIVGVRVETVARTLGGWKREGVLTIGADGCHFSCLDQLRALVAD